jgi:hypothetical protein
MRILRGIVIVLVGFNVGCANRSATQPAATAGTQTSRPAAPAPAPAPQLATRAQLTPDDYRGFMKTVGATYPMMRMHLMEGMTAEAAKEAQVLALTFGDVERFWTQNNKPEAIKLAQEARNYATQTAGSAAAGDAAKATMTATNMQGMCKQCHGLYREMDPANAGGFRIKPGVIAGS